MDSTVEYLREKLTERWNTEPLCNKCAQPMLDGEPVEVTWNNDPVAHINCVKSF